MKDIETIRAEIEEENRRHDELLQTLEIPAYTDRNLQAQWVQSKEISGEYHAIRGTSGWTAGCPKEVFDLLEVGDPYVLETKGFNEISGWLVNGKWYDRRSDQDLQRARDSWLEESKRRQEEYVAKHREEWVVREAALPEWAGKRMKAIREKNPDFESQPMGWGYELIAMELAVLYAAMGESILDKDYSSIEDTDEIKKFAEENGTSGNQHSFGLAYAKAYLRGEV